MACICNLTALKNNLARLVEEGCVHPLAYINKLAPLHTQRLSVHAFCNLASCSRSRGKMTNQSIGTTLLELVQTNDEEVKLQCAITISLLAMDVVCLLSHEVTAKVAGGAHPPLPLEQRAHQEDVRRRSLNAHEAVIVIV